MEKKIFNTPALYGDHHVTEVRKQLLALPGVQDVYASSAFFVVEVTYDESKVSEDALRGKLAEWGYLTEIKTMTETGSAFASDMQNSMYRHPAVYETLKKTVSFQHYIAGNTRPLWYCPGMGVVNTSDN